MFHSRFVAVAAALLITAVGMIPPVAMAQNAETAASTPKQIKKFQRKEARKANRARKDAEIGPLEKNGYNPSANQPDYPQNIQNAEKKAAAAKASSTP
jgi:hypothetical protein